MKSFSFLFWNYSPFEEGEQVVVVCRSWQTPYFWSPEPASWCPLGFNTKQWAVNFQSKVLMEATRKTSCCNAKAGSKVWLWQMLNVDGGRGESSLLLLYNSSYNLLHRQTPSPLWPPYNLVHCFCQPELMHAGLLLVLLCLFHLAVHLLFQPLILISWIILSFTSSQSPNSHVQLIHSALQLNWRRAPPSFLAASLPLLELLVQVSQWAVVRQRCLLFKKNLLPLFRKRCYIIL